MLATSLWMTMAMAVAADAKAAVSTSDAVIPVCHIVSLERQEVPGADAGVLTQMVAKEGMRVTKGMELGRVDDRESRAQLNIKQFELEAADQEANSDVGIRYQAKTADVAEAFWEKLKQANRGAKGAVSDIEVQRAKLEWDKAKLGIEKETEQNLSNKLTAKAKKAEVEAAKVVVNRRILVAPFDGVVLKISKHPGEWVAPGEPVVEIVRVDRLSIRGGLVADQWLPSDIDGRDVTVEVALPRGRIEKVPGKVVFVSPVVSGGKLDVWAEIDTPMEKDGRPLVPAGLTAMMTIHVSKPAKVADAHPPAAAPRGAPSGKATTKK
jgi:multidrug resistance efflux pump